MSTRSVITTTIVAALAAGAGAQALAADGGTKLATTLAGATEVPAPGDDDGTGSAQLRLNQGLGQICSTIEVSGVDPLRAAHIHRAPAGSAGSIVVTLPLTSGCTDVDPALVKEIRQSPEAFYVNVHNAPFPAGALRGQLG